MHIYVRDHKEELIDALQNIYDNPPEKAWRFLARFEVGDIFAPSDETPFDAFVSPANSFGWMDGGIDLHFVEMFGWELQDSAMAAAKSQPFGEMLIGSAALIETADEDWPHMIMAPTMRTPRRIADENVFLATRAAMIVAYQNKFKSVVFPGMGTGTGGVPSGDAALAMLTGMQAAALRQPD